MRKRKHSEYLPDVERLETKRPLSTASAHAAAAAAATTPTITIGPNAAVSTDFAYPPDIGPGITAERILNPKGNNATLDPPFQQVLVQMTQPVPGQVYNVCYLVLYNGTKETFTANQGIYVRISNQAPSQGVPLLTGNQTWVPGQHIVLYVLTKKYYPFTPTQSAGFQLNFLRPRFTLIPGPSGIFLRLKYNPATFAKNLDDIVAYGVGAYGHQFGMPDTAIWQIIPLKPHNVRP